MVSKAVYKVPGGKLVKVELEQQRGQISRVKITGDFFVHPEEALLQIEGSLRGCSLEENEISRKIEMTVSEIGCQLVGFSAQDIAKAIVIAYESENLTN